MNDKDITLEYKQKSKTNPTLVVLTVKDGDKQLQVDQLDLSKAEKRTQFVGELLKKLPGLEELKDELNQRLIDNREKLRDAAGAG